MEESAFMRELARYRRVRDRNWVAPVAGTTRVRAAAAPALTAPPTAAAPLAPPAAAAPAPDAPAPPLPEASLLYADFWAGLDALLALHFSKPSDVRAVTQAFDALHYGEMRGYNYEDVDDVSRMLLRECGAGAR
jgi:hypothetical protein